MKRAGLAPLAGAAMLLGASTASATTWQWQDDFTDSSAFADSVAFSLINFASFTGTATPCVNVTEALGPPDGTVGGCNGFYSTGEGGVVVLEFTDNVLVGDGNIATPELAVFEGGDHPERYWTWIAASIDPLNPFGGLDLLSAFGPFDPLTPDVNDILDAVATAGWVLVENSSNGTDYIDIDWATGGDTTTEFRYVALWDLPWADAFDQGQWAGIDLDAVGVLAPVPLPATGLLLLAGLGGLAAFRRRTG